MDQSEAPISFERPMPIEHRIAYGLFGCGAVAVATLLVSYFLPHVSESTQTSDTAWWMIGSILLIGIPMIAAAVIGGHAEVSLDRKRRILQEVAWVGPIPAWRQAFPFKDVDKPLIIDERNGRPFRVEIAVKNRTLVPVGKFLTRAEATDVAQAILAALDPTTLPPYERSRADKFGAKARAVLLQGIRGPRDI